MNHQALAAVGEGLLPGREERRKARNLSAYALN